MARRENATHVGNENDDLQVSPFGVSSIVLESKTHCNSTYCHIAFDLFGYTID